MTNRLAPLISVVMPVYNAAPYVREAVVSVLSQTYAPLELICVDDGSRDDSLLTLQEFGDAITVIVLEKNSGIAFARNAGIRVAKGEYLAFMDADDIWEPNKLSLQMEAFAKDPTLDLCGTHFSCFISPELPEEIQKLRHCPAGFLSGYVPPTTVVKRATFSRVGEFDPQWRVGEFIDWISRAQALGVRMAMVPEVLLRRRIHETNTGVVARDKREDYVRIARAALLRKRNGPSHHD